MILKLAIRNLVHDRIRLISTLIGYAFAVTLIGAQLGLFLGASRQITAMVDHAAARIWIVPQGTESFEDGLPVLDQSKRYQALATPGVSAVAPLVVSFADWRRPDGALASVVVVGTDATPDGLKPWSVVAGSSGSLFEPNGALVDRSYLGELGLDGVGSRAEIEGRSLRVAGLTAGLRSFTQSPYVFTSTAQARRFLGTGPDAATFFLVSLAPGGDAAAVKAVLAERMDNVEVLTAEEFRARCLDRWLMQTGAGFALIGGLVLGLIIGVVIVAQTIFSSTNEHLMEYATLRALGSSRGYLGRIVLSQAVAASLLGFVCGGIGVAAVAWMSIDTPLPLVLPPIAQAGLFLLTLVIGVVAASGAMIKVTRTDPGVVFSR